MENEELHEKYFLTNLDAWGRNSDLGQILQRIFPAGKNTWARFVIDMDSIVKVKWAFTWSINGSLIFTRFLLCNYLITPEERPKVYFPSYLETKISAIEALILSSFPASFQRFPLKFGENVAR